MGGIRPPLLLLLPLLLAAAGLAPPAGAHPYTLEAVPPQLSSAPVGTDRVIVFYSEALEVDFSALRVFDGGGEQIDNRDTSYYRGEESLVVTTPPLEEGVYTVTSKVLSKVDGHLVPDAFVFGVGDVAVQDAPDRPSELIFYPEAAARFPGLAGQAVVLGAAIAAVAVWGTQRRDWMGPGAAAAAESAFRCRFLSVTGVGIIAVIASNVLILAVQTARLEAPVLDVLQTSFGAVWAARMGISAALLAAWFAFDRGGGGGGGAGGGSARRYLPILAVSLALISTTSMIGHGAASGQPGAVALDYLHSLVAAAWIGGVILFAFAILPSLAGAGGGRGEGAALAMIPRFSIMATVALGAVVVSGPVLMWMLESDVGTIAESTYGRLIMAKILIAAAMVGMGAYHQFGIQRGAEGRMGSGMINVSRRLGRALRVESAMGIALLGVVALLANGTLPAGEIQPAGAPPAGYGFSAVEFSGPARFAVEVHPFASGANTVTARVTDPQGGALDDLDGVKVKVSNPEKGITPIEVEMAGTGDGAGFAGEATFGFSGRWLVEVEARRAGAANEAVSLHLLVKPRLGDLRTDITEYELPAAGKPLYPAYDRGGGAVWFSDTTRPVLWRFTVEDERFEQFGFEGQASQMLAVDGGGKVWFTDIPSQRIGYLDPATSETEVIGLPEIPPGEVASTPIAIEADADDNIWVSIITKGVLLKYRQGPGEFEEYRLGDRQGGPFALEEDGAGRIWYSESAAGRIGYVDPGTGEVSGVDAGFAIAGPEALIADGDGNLWITEHTGSGIVRYNTVLGTFERIPVAAADSLPFGMAFDRYGNLWFAQHQIDLIGVYDPHNRELMDVPVPTEGSYVQFVTSDDDGNIWFAEAEGGKIGVVRISEAPPAGPAPARADPARLQYTELASPLVAAGIVAASLFLVKGVGDKRRIDGRIPGAWRAPGR